jgi:hypothetical protein
MLNKYRISLFILLLLVESNQCEKDDQNNKKKPISQEEAKKKLQKYFELRKECPFELNSYYQNETTEIKTPTDEIKKKYCPSYADFLLCFPTTPINQTLYFKCPLKSTYQKSNR